MAYFAGNIRSKVLGLDTSVNLILPGDYSSSTVPTRPYDKVLYMLHGLKQNASSWPRMSGIERYADAYGFAVVIPEVQRSWYCDMPGGNNYFTYITEELPQLIGNIIRLPQGRENTYIGGLSMGGYGALKCALRRPDQYAGAMCFSGGYFSLEDPQHLIERYYKPGELQSILGQAFNLRAEDSLDYLIRHFPDHAPKPKLYLACGTEDFLYPANIRARNLLDTNGFDLTWESWPGIHDWAFWDVAADRAMKLFSGSNMP